MPIESVELLERLGVALGLGLLMGWERGWHGRELAEGRRVAGVRTFGLISLLGGTAAALASSFGGLILAAALVALAVLTAVAHWRAIEVSQDVSITTSVAALIAFAFGALAGLGLLAVAAAGAVVATLLLSLKPELHGLLQRVERPELLATVRLILISVVLLPVLPDQGYGPWNALNPYRMWWMVVLVAAISYVGYYAIKLAGRERGILLTGLLGGLASSTAVALSFGRLAKRAPAGADLIAAGIVVAGATMLPRLLLIVGLIAPELFAPLAAPLVPASLVAIAAAGWLARRGEGALGDGGGELKPTNPFELRVALQFGMLLALVMVLTRAADEWFGAAGVYALGAVSGLADVDAIALSYASASAEGAIGAEAAAGALLIAAAVNTAVKPVLVVVVGGGAVALRAAAAFLLASLAGAAGHLLSTAAG